MSKKEKELTGLNKKYPLSIMLVFILLVAVFLSACGKTGGKSEEIKTFTDLKNCRFAISDGNSSYEAQIKNEISGVIFQRYTNYFDTFIAVAKGNADAAFAFKYTFYGVKESYPNLTYVESDLKIPIVANFSAGSDELKKDFNRFIVDAEQSGLLDKLAEKWLYKYEDLNDDDIVDFSELDKNEKSFKFGVCDTNVPYEYLRNGRLTGYEPALLYEFCKACGYRPNVTASTYEAVVAGVAAGKYDMAMGGYGYTDERSENSHFSDSFFNDTVVYAVNGGDDNDNIFERIQSGFKRTFIAQNRWKLFADGIFVTFLISVMSVVIGSIAGFILFLLGQQTKWIQRLSYRINDTLEALPVLVVLMLFFYIIFGKTDISGILVSIIVFGLCFTFTFFALLSNSVRVVPIEQMEAGLALGYTTRQSLFKIVLPQAMETFIPSIRAAIVATLKSTAIVGYVAVQDLTKAGDLIRSQTFEAFLPIITVAILYFALAKILIFLLNRFLVTPSERRRKREEGK